jgi:hypothetical protein
MKLDKLGGEGAEPIAPLRSTEFNGDVLPLNVAQLAQSPPECLRQGRSGAPGHGEIPNPGDLRCWLCLGRERGAKENERHEGNG